MENIGRIISILERVKFGLLIAVATCFPLLIDGGAPSAHTWPKQFFLLTIVAALVILFAVRAVLTKELVWRRSALDMAVGVLLLALLLSMIFSSARSESWLGPSD